MTLPSFDVFVVWLKTIFVKVMIFREQKKFKQILWIEKIKSDMIITYEIFFLSKK